LKKFRSSDWNKGCYDTLAGLVEQAIWYWNLVMPAKILVVDDDARNLKNLSQFLRIEGYEVDEAHSGNEAVKRLTAGGFNLVLSDLIMPGGNGLDLLERSRSIAPGVPVVMMSGFESIDLVEMAELGASDFVTKPIAFEELLSKVKRALHEP
jgi:DNA-binding NtrC family response regulator